MFFWNYFAFSMIQQMLAIWSLVPLPFLNPAWTSRNSWFTCCWNLSWRILCLILLACVLQGWLCLLLQVSLDFILLHSSSHNEKEIKLPTSTGSSKKQESSRKTSTSALLTNESLWLCGSQQTMENSSRDGNARPPDLPPEKSVCRSRSNSKYWTWNSRLDPNWERSMSRLYIVALLI